MLLNKAKSLLHKFIPSPFEGAYHLGIIPSALLKLDSPDWYKKTDWIDDSSYLKEGWFADPFFLKLDEERIYILAEQMFYPIGHGRIVKLVIERKRKKILQVVPILQLDTHLSFPIIHRENNKVYVYPENYQGGSLRIYEYDERSEKLINPQVLINEPLLDSQLIKYEGYYYIFATKFIEGKWEETRNLFIYRAENLFGPYEEFQVITNRYNEERGAGTIYNNGDSFIRPAQCCEDRYGSNTILYNVKKANGLFSEEIIGRILPDEHIGNGMLLHTFNKFNDLSIIDGYSDKYPIYKKIATKIYTLLGKNL